MRDLKKDFEVKIYKHSSNISIEQEHDNQEEKLEQEDIDVKSN